MIAMTRRGYAWDLADPRGLGRIVRRSRNRITGLLFQPNDMESLVAALRQLKTDPAFARRSGSAARARIE